LKSFAELTPRGQGRRLRPLAWTVLSRYGFEVRQISLLANDVNAVFRVDTTDGNKYALRIGTPRGCHGLDEIRSELAWLRELQQDPRLGVPHPVPAEDGSLVRTAEADGVPGARHCVVFDWVPGVDLAERLTEENACRLGRLTALLHGHAEFFSPSEGFRVRTLDKVFPYSDAGFPLVERVALFEERGRRLLTRRTRKVYLRAIRHVQRALEALFDRQERLRIVHNDLHPWNIKVCRGKLYAMDFEELMWGYPVQDIAATFYYLRLQPTYPALREAYERGYRGLNPWPQRHPGEIDAFVVDRALILVNFVLASGEQRHREMAPEYVAKVAERLESILDAAGTYNPGT
jgi:Ser/Thr protein kinase RdoA (MazF antagonist)